MAERTSRVSGFYRLAPEERAQLVGQWAGLTPSDLVSLQRGATLSLPEADRMIENVVGVYPLPLGVASNLTVNGRDYLVPMAIEEPSVVAGVSSAARLLRPNGGIQAGATEPVMIGQIQVLDLPDLAAARDQLLARRDDLLLLADQQDPVLVRLGGGARELRVRPLTETAVGPMLLVEILVDCRDAMGANTVNTICEKVAPLVEKLTGGRVNLRILSNLADERLAHAQGSVPTDALALEDVPGADVAQRIVEVWALADADPHRAATHNKGIMNGIDAVALATGNDWRAVEAGAHAYAARSGRYSSLSRWWLDEQGNLCGRLQLPLAVGVVGGATRVHRGARLALQILGVQSGRELAEVMAAVGLAQNLAAIRALATTGIQAGHMRLHARQLAVAAGATGDRVDLVVQQLIQGGTIRLDIAQEIVHQLEAA